MSGTIITFYSYKGGTGRSMAVANTAWILASNGLRVLVLDWDLEAPGVHGYFRPFLSDPDLRSSPGVIDLLWAFAEAAVDVPDDEQDPDQGEFTDATAESGPAWYEEYARVAPYAVSVRYDGFPGAGTVDVVPAGRQDASYARMVSGFDWADFYDRLGGGAFLEALKRDVREAYDYVLIDSRTGLSDTAGICTVQMPDILVDCFSLSTQAIDGAAAVAASAERQHRGGLRVFPVPMRVEDAESDKLDAARDYAHARLGRFLSHIGDPERYWSQVEIPYKSFYAYEETLATIGDRPLAENTVLAATERMVRHLTDGRVTGLRSDLGESERRSLLAAFRRQAPAAAGRSRLFPHRPAPRVLIAFDDGDAQHVEQVRDLWYLLRQQGIDARMDRGSWLGVEPAGADALLEVAPPPRGGSAASAVGPSYRDRIREAALSLPRTLVVLPGMPASVLTDLRSQGKAPVVVKELTDRGVQPLALVLASTGGARPPEDTAARRTAGWTPRPSAGSAVIKEAVAFAARVRRQLDEETALRGLTRIAPVPVRWLLTEPAAVPGRHGSSAAAGRTGNVQDLHDLLLELPARQMLLLGEPGAGKSGAALLLARRMLDGYRPGTPVPVVLPAATWAPDTESLWQWVARRMRRDSAVPPGRSGRAWTQALIDNGLLLPVLDGLDELPDDLLDAALRDLAALPADQPLVVTCRTGEYRLAYHRTGQVLQKAATVELLPVTPLDATRYLAATVRSGDPRWRPVLEALHDGPGSAIAEVLTTPLMLELARTAYQPPSTEPAELLALDLDSARSLLLRRYVRAAYGEPVPGPHGRKRLRYPPERAESWLAFLARWQSRQAEGDGIAWWRLHTACPRAASQMLLVLLDACFGGVQMALGLAMVWAVAGRTSPYVPAGGFLPWTLAGVAAGALAGAVGRPPASHGRSVWPWFLPGSGLPRHGRAFPGPVSPRESLRRDLSPVLAPLVMLVSIPIVVAVSGYPTGAAVVVLVQLVMTTIWLGAGAWAWYRVAAWQLAARGALPLDLMRFLEDARRRGVLRQDGARFAFRQAALRDALLTRR